MFCKSCGSHMEDEYNVCQNCGTKKGVGNVYCEKCGAVRQVGVAFCQECGNKFEDSQAAAQGSVPYAQQTAAQQFQSVAQMNNAQYMPAKKFCRNCGSQVMNNQAVCTKCGVRVGDGTSFCPHCAAAVQNPQQTVCMSCGMSLKQTFDANNYFGQLGKNFASAFDFKNPAKTIFKFGPYFLALLVFIFSFLPNLTASTVTSVSSSSLYGGSMYGYAAPATTYTTSQSYGFFNGDMGKSGIGGGFVLCGVLLIFTLVLAILRFEPHIYNFIEEKPYGRLFDLVLPGLELVAIISAIINIWNVNAIMGFLSFASSQGSVHLSVCGWFLLIFIVASAVLAVISIIQDKDKLNAPAFAELAMKYGPFALAVLCFYISLMPTLSFTALTNSATCHVDMFKKALGASGSYGVVSLGGAVFGNVLFVIGLLVGIAGQVPPLNKLIMKFRFGGLAYLVAPCLGVVALISTFISIGIANGAIGAPSGQGFGLSVWGVILILAVVGTGVFGVLAFIKTLNKNTPNNGMYNMNSINNMNNMNNMNQF